MEEREGRGEAAKGGEKGKAKGKGKSVSQRFCKYVAADLPCPDGDRCNFSHAQDDKDRDEPPPTAAASPTGKAKGKPKQKTGKGAEEATKPTDPASNAASAATVLDVPRGWPVVDGDRRSALFRSG